MPAQPQSARASRPRTRTSTGCISCRRHRLKCDNGQPSCGSCLELGLRCRWLVDRDSLLDDIRQGQRFTTGLSYASAVPESGRVLDAYSISTRDHHYAVSTESNHSFHIERAPTSPRSRSPEERQKTSALSTRLAPTQQGASCANEFVFDHPSICRASPTSMLLDQSAKQMYQYLCERGDTIMRFPVPSVPKLAGFNIWKPALVMANKHPGMMNANLAVAAMHLAAIHPEFRAISVKYYLRALQSMSEALRSSSGGPPAQWICVSAATLNLYEMSLFEKPAVRMVHFLGFQAFVEARQRQAPDDWAPGKLTLAVFTHLFATQATFHRDQLIRDKPIQYIDKLVDSLNKPPMRPLGPDIMGVPPIFISTAYKLSFLRTKDTQQPPWLLEISSITQTLENWHCAPELYQPYNRDRLFAARLYHLASLVFAYKLKHRSISTRDAAIQSLVREAASITRAYPSTKPPVIILGWPLAILSVAAVRPADIRALRAPIERLVSLCGLVGFKSVLDLIDRATQKQPGERHAGLDILFNDEALKTVHI